MVRYLIAIVASFCCGSLLLTHFSRPTGQPTALPAAVRLQHMPAPKDSNRDSVHGGTRSSPAPSPVGKTVRIPVQPRQSGASIAAVKSKANAVNPVIARIRAQAQKPIAQAVKDPTPADPMSEFTDVSGFSDVEIRHVQAAIAQAAQQRAAQAAQERAGQAAHQRAAQAAMEQARTAKLYRDALFAQSQSVAMPQTSVDPPPARISIAPPTQVLQPPALVSLAPPKQVLPPPFVFGPVISRDVIGPVIPGPPVVGPVYASQVVGPVIPGPPIVGPVYSRPIIGPVLGPAGSTGSAQLLQPVFAPVGPIGFP